MICECINEWIKQGGSDVTSLIMLTCLPRDTFLSCSLLHLQKEFYLHVRSDWFDWENIMVSALIKQHQVGEDVLLTFFFLFGKGNIHCRLQTSFYKN